MKVSFDFDNTISHESVQSFALMCKDMGCDVWIVTSRFDDKYNDDLFEVARQLDIPRDNVVFTGWKDKSEFFEENPDFIFHLDDDSIEIELITERTSVKAIDVFSDSEWREKCLSLLNEKR